MYCHYHDSSLNGSEKTILLMSRQSASMVGSTRSPSSALVASPYQTTLPKGGIQKKRHPFFKSFHWRTQLTLRRKKTLGHDQIGPKPTLRVSEGQGDGTVSPFACISAVRGFLVLGGSLQKWSDSDHISPKKHPPGIKQTGLINGGSTVVGELRLLFCKQFIFVAFLFGNMSDPNDSANFSTKSAGFARSMCSNEFGPKVRRRMCRRRPPSRLSWVLSVFFALRA